ncbi:Hypothetical predicted protein [Podarcis lilfordi]|uniref:Uncharacterized protein n=1 Tax=Podarcis lilfordi TaxID=74358 RepID=A0AA35KBS0_9SAUR|nr:Hypothetical predicted protein [Podarcis lilfordi]
MAASLASGGPVFSPTMPLDSIVPYLSQYRTMERELDCAQICGISTMLEIAGGYLHKWGNHTTSNMEEL